MFEIMPFRRDCRTLPMVDVLKAMHDTDKHVVAMIAPAVVGQFAGNVNNLVGALKAAGFDDVIEVAVGADITTEKEAAEFIERMEAGEKFMTTSCCPAYFRAAQLHIPEIKEYVSSTKTPMYYTAELVKQERPDSIAVFVGPCFAKRVEAETDPNVDYVLTFEEMNAILPAPALMLLPQPLLSSLKFPAHKDAASRLPEALPAQSHLWLRARLTSVLKRLTA